MKAHAEQLTAPAASVLLDELALSAPAGLIGQHRDLLAAAREDGIAAVYR